MSQNDNTQSKPFLDHCDKLEDVQCPLAVLALLGVRLFLVDWDVSKNDCNPPATEEERRRLSESGITYMKPMSLPINATPNSIGLCNKISQAKSRRSGEAHILISGIGTKDKDDPTPPYNYRRSVSGTYPNPAKYINQIMDGQLVSWNYLYPTFDMTDRISYVDRLIQSGIVSQPMQKTDLARLHPILFGGKQLDFDKREEVYSDVLIRILKKMSAMVRGDRNNPFTIQAGLTNLKKRFLQDEQINKWYKGCQESLIILGKCPWLDCYFILAHILDNKVLLSPFDSTGSHAMLGEVFSVSRLKPAYSKFDLAESQKDLLYFLDEETPDCDIVEDIIKLYRPKAARLESEYDWREIIRSCLLYSQELKMGQKTLSSWNNIDL